MKSFVRKSTDLFKKNYLNEEGSRLWERVYVVKNIRLSLKNKPIFSSRKEICIKHRTSYTAFFP